MSENDGIDDALRAVSQVAAGIIARAAELQARRGETAARQRGHHVEIANAHTAQHAARVAAERQAAQVRLGLVHDPAWWHTASAGDIAQAWGIALAGDPGRVTGAAVDVITRQLDARYGITPATHATPGDLQRQIEQAAADRRRANREPSNTARQPVAAHAAGDLGRNHSLGAGGQDAGDAGPGREPHAVRRYDSAGQREARARRYEASGNAQAAEARRVADTSQGASAIFATTGGTKSRRRGRRPNTLGPRAPQRYDRGR